jgi:hypothetical protein
MFARRRPYETNYEYCCYTGVTAQGGGEYRFENNLLSNYLRKKNLKYCCNSMKSKLVANFHVAPHYRY